MILNFKRSSTFAFAVPIHLVSKRPLFLRVLPHSVVRKDVSTVFIVSSMMSVSFALDDLIKFPQWVAIFCHYKLSPKVLTCPSCSIKCNWFYLERSVSCHHHKYFLPISILNLVISLISTSTNASTADRTCSSVPCPQITSYHLQDEFVVLYIF